MPERGHRPDEPDRQTPGAAVREPDAPAPAMPDLSPAAHLLGLQQSAGNVAVARYIQAKRGQASQRPAARRRPAGGTLARNLLARNITGSYPVSTGIFEADMQTREGGGNTPPAHSGLDGYIRFVPNADAPNCNKLVFIQIVKLTDKGGTDVDPGSMGAAQAPRGGLGDPGVRTQDDAARGVQGGFFTDASHQGATQGQGLSPNYDVVPAAAGTTGAVGQTQQTAQYGGGTGGNFGEQPGFKRSSEAADIRSVALYDTPGIRSATRDLDFDFESVAKGEDTGVVYGAFKWGFKIRAGKVIDEYSSTEDNASATFNEAMERHRDFYVHEPVTFYFPFNSTDLPSTEAAKIDEFKVYLDRNPTVRLSLEGFADLKGGNSAYNRRLSQERGEAVAQALIAKGIDPGRIDAPIVGSGASSTATANAGTGDQGGDAAAAADQDREENRQFNRRVVLSFRQTASTPVGGAGP